MSQIFKRSLTAIFFLIVLTSVYYYGNNISMLAIIYAITLLSFYEWTSMESLSKIKPILFFTLILVVPFFDIINMYFISFFSLCLWIFLIIYMLIDSEQLKKLVKRYHTLLGFLIFSILFLHLANLFPITNTININDDLFHNKFYFLMLVCLITVIDTSAYAIGKSLGKNKIVSNISPNKTLEGYIGSYILSIVFFIIFFNTNNMSWTINDLIFLNIFILFSFFGDLFISLVKRIYKAKDTGTFLPGHGGILDRLDSYLPTLPVYYIWFMI